MKRSFYTLVFLFITLALVEAQPDSLYLRANSLYQLGKYEEAIEVYDSIIFAGVESADLYYNMGNACFRSNKLGMARLFYEKALKINPRDEDVLANLNYLETMLVDRFEEVPIIFYKKWIKSLVLSCNSNQWAYFSIISFILCIISVLAYLFFRRILFRKTGFYLGLIFLLFSLLSLAASWKQYRLIIKPDAAIVTDLSVNAKSAPHESGTVLFILHEGAKVWLGDNTADWREIRLSDGRKGWVPESSIQSI